MVIFLIIIFLFLHPSSSIPILTTNIPDEEKDTTSSVVSQDSVPKIKPKRIRKPKKKVFTMRPPKNYNLVPNGDIRYTYPHLMIDCFGAGNSTKFRSLMKDICSPDIIFECDYDGECF